MPAQWTDGGTGLRLAQEVLLHGPASRAELAVRFALNPGTVTRLTQDLIERGVLTERGVTERPDFPAIEYDPSAVHPNPIDPSAIHQPNRAGRPSRPLHIAPISRTFIGIKITSDALLGVATDVNARVLSTSDVPLSDHDPSAVVEHVANLAESLAATAGTALAAGAAVASGAANGAVSLGVSIGGLVRDGDVVRSTFLTWHEVALEAMLRERFGPDVTVVNDLQAVTEATRLYGLGRGSEHFALVTLGAGIGLGLVHGRPVAGDDVGVGLVGHLPVDPDGPLCDRGHRGCARAMLTTQALTSAGSQALGRDVGYDELLSRAGDGEPPARAVVDRAGLGLGRMLALVANIATPELLIIGGEGAVLAEVAAEALEQGWELERDELAPPVDRVIQPGGLAEWARGAAVVAIEEFVGLR